MILDMQAGQFFWMYSQIIRIEADEDLRALGVAAAAGSTQEGFDKIHSGLTQMRGEIETFKAVRATIQVDTNDDELDPEFDREGLRALKARHGA